VDAAARHERDRVDRLAVDPGLEVEVASGRRAGRADPGDLLAGVDGVADRDLDAAVLDVGVAGLDAVAVLEQDSVAVGAVPPRLHDRAGGGRGRRSGGRAGVDRVR